MKLQVLLFVAATAVMHVTYGHSESRAQIPEVGIENGFGYPLHVWIWPRERKSWVRPVPYLTREGSINLSLATPGDYYLLARDSADNDDPLGWVDMHEIVRRAPDARFVIDGQYVSEARTRTYKVTKMVPEQRIRRVCVWRNGQWVIEERTYTVYKPVWETRTQEIQVKRPVLELKVRYNGKTSTLSEFLETTAPESKP